MHGAIERTDPPPDEADMVFPTALPMLGQQLSTIMEHGIQQAERRAVAGREHITHRRPTCAVASRWKIRRNPRARLQWLMTLAGTDRSGRAVAMLTFEDSAEGALLLDAFEARLVEASARNEDLSSLLRRGFDSDLRTVKSAFTAIRRLVLAGAFTMLDSAHPHED